MFVYKSKPLAFGFAAAAMVVGLAAQPAQADRRNAQWNDYCSAPEVCSQRQIGIIQKERDGVNYFYGGSDVPAPQVNYIYLRDDTIDQPAAEPIYISNSNNTSFSAPLSNHRFKMKKDHWKWKKKHPGLLDLPGGNAGVNYKGP
ncbi:MAG TPA: hypothetical protein VM144_18500 [Aestuariivirga sp.]|nr:hypothetical protein [Aestuariivirga sp.]